MEPLVSKVIEDYCAAHTSAADPLLAELADYTRAHCKNPQMLTGPVEGTLLRLLVQISGARRVLEIGTYTGYSALNMAMGLADGGEVVTCELDPNHARIAQSFFDRSVHGKKIRLKLGPALKTIEALPADTSPDLVFLDADKENYLAYYEAVLPRLRSGGLIAADNTLWSGKVLAPREKTDHAIVAFNARVARDPRVEHVLLSVRDGVMLIRKR
ncbi:MAG: class I SAM-dependent methyltransferase [Betaproteobacteria bacterium]|nr:MAG: class I SAM-dependent methyltransferase [Betaproteobacteria bacterium]